MTPQARLPPLGTPGPLDLFVPVHRELPTRHRVLPFVFLARTVRAIRTRAAAAGGGSKRKKSCTQSSGNRHFYSVTGLLRSCFPLRHDAGE